MRIKWNFDSACYTANKLYKYFRQIKFVNGAGSYPISLRHHRLSMREKYYWFTKEALPAPSRYTLLINNFSVGSCLHHIRILKAPTRALRAFTVYVYDVGERWVWSFEHLRRRELCHDPLPDRGVVVEFPLCEEWRSLGLYFREYAQRIRLFALVSAQVSRGLIEIRMSERLRV